MAESGGSASAPGDGTRGRILVVEDDAATRSAIERALRGRGYHIRAVGSGEDALPHAADADLVLLDLMLPGIDGWEVCRRIRQGGPGPAVVMMTAHADPLVRERSAAAGADFFLPKPFRVAELLRAVADQLAARDPSSGGR